MAKHLVFYDGQCGLCDRAVQFLLRADKKQIFVFAPLQGKTAALKLSHLSPEIRNADSLILIENYETADNYLSIFGKGAFRILWLLGGAWSLLGWISFLPGCLYDWGYRLVARNRHYFFSQDSCVIPDLEEKKRFLP